MTVLAVSPWRTALQRDACLPACVFGPVLLSALQRLASICRYEVMEECLPASVRFVVLRRPHRLRFLTDVSSAKGREPLRSDQYRSASTRRLHRRSDGLRGGGRDRAGP